jgi:hypothetical protein
MDWADQYAATIVDAFLAYPGTNDLVELQRAIAAALCRAHALGKTGQVPDTILKLFDDSSSS